MMFSFLRVVNSANPLKELPLGMFSALKKLTQLDLRYTYVGEDTDALATAQTSLAGNSTRLLKLLIAPINENQHHQYQPPQQSGFAFPSGAPNMGGVIPGQPSQHPMMSPMGPPGAVPPPFGVPPAHGGLPPRPGMNPPD